MNNDIPISVSRQEAKKMNQDDLVQKEYLNELIRERDFLQKEHWYHLRKFEERRNDVNEIENIIRKVCKHNWVLHPHAWEPCGTQPKICTICHLDL